VAEGTRSVEQRVWWGGYSIPHGRAGRWQIGPLKLVVTRLEHEWRICRGTTGNPADNVVAIEVPTTDHDVGAGALMTRYGTEDDDESIELIPVMPDRSVVTRPEDPLTVPAQEAVTVYVGSPLWLRLTAGVPARELGDFPVFPPQLTWWGPDTMDGETCYATRTYGRLRLVDARPGPHRVMTAIRILNRASLPLLIERLNLPVKNLSIYSVGRSTRLWTEAVTMERAEGEEFAELTVEESPGPDVDGAVLLSAPREPPQRNQLFRAFGKLFQ
jgi:hypothetical protein